MPLHTNHELLAIKRGEDKIRTATNDGTKHNKVSSITHQLSEALTAIQQIINNPTTVESAEVLERNLGIIRSFFAKQVDHVLYLEQLSHRDYTYWQDATTPEGIRITPSLFNNIPKPKQSNNEEKQITKKERFLLQVYGVSIEELGMTFIKIGHNTKTQ